MPKSDLVFGSFSTATSNGKYYKTQPINFPTPEKDIEVYGVPGRSGDLIVDYGSYKNVEITAEIAIQATAPDTFLTLYDALRASIMVQSGYQRLEDSLYPNEYRLARPTGLEMQQADSMRGTATITFNAKPQRYYTSGDNRLIDINPANAATTGATTGYGDELLNNAVLTALTNAGQRTDILYAALDLSKFAYNATNLFNIGFRRYNVLRLYPDGVQVLQCNGSPFAGGTATNITVTTQILNSFGNASFTPPNAAWLVIPVPYSAQVTRNGQNVWFYVFDSGWLAPSVATVSYSPLITLRVGGALTADDAVIINKQCSISLNTPATIDGQTLEYIYIDCETYNAYTVINGTTYNLNPYVTMTGDFLFTGIISVQATDDINYLYLAPKWWTI